MLAYAILREQEDDDSKNSESFRSPYNFNL